MITRRLELIFLGLGSVAAIIFVALSLPAVWARSVTPSQPQTTQDETVIPAESLGGDYVRTVSALSPSAVIGSIRIPSLHINAPMIEGVEEADLRRGVGHLPGSAFGGGLGNAILAAHRDGIFRPLQSINKGMDIEVEGADGTYHYQVDSTLIVTPDQLDVLAIADQPTVTLITCYPFNFIGSAPKRFIVKAHLVSAAADRPAHSSR